ncbi:MAG: hypothetical protein JHD28_03540 [Bacteroidia bacterium]|nr:hypothetical protein [Bacteroidia bacterium]
MNRLVYYATLIDVDAVTTTQQSNLNLYTTAPNSNGINLYFNQIRAYFGQSIADQILNEFLPNSNLYVDKLMLNEWQIYGSSRLGIYKAEVLVASKTLTQSNTPSANGNEPTYSLVEQNPPVLDYASYNQIRGAKNYELSNHLGNVLVVVTDKKTYNCGNTELINASFDNGSYNNIFPITSNTSMSLSGNKLTVGGTNTQVGTIFNMEGEAGRIFKVDFDLTIGSGLSQVWFETNASYNSTGGGLSQNVTNSSSSGHVSFTFTAPQGAYRFKIGGTGTGTYSVDNLIVKEVGPGRYQAEIVTANDYSPFGAPMPGRSFKADNVLVKTTLSTSNFTTGTDGWVATTNATLSNVFGNIRATVTAVNAGMKKTFSTEPGKTYRVMFKINLRGWPYMYIKDKYTNTNLLSITNFIVPGDASYTFTATGFETDVIFNEASNPAGSIQLANFTLEEVEANSGYRFSFNGKERDNETYGEGYAYDYGARIYDSRLGKWLSLDPASSKYPMHSNYSFAANSPIKYYDRDGKFLGTIIGAVVGGATAAFRGESIKRGAISGAVQGAVWDLSIGAVIITGGAATPAVLVAAGTLSSMAGDLVYQSMGAGFNNVNVKENLMAGAFGGLTAGILGSVAPKLARWIINRNSKVIIEPIHQLSAEEFTPPKQSLGPNEPPQRIEGPWTTGDLSRASNGKGPIDMIPTVNRAGNPRPLELHHGDQMPCSAIHEVPAGHLKTVDHPNVFNQGVTPQMRNQDSRLHWQMRGQEMGNPPPPKK